LKRSFRLTRSTDFERVRRFGKSYAHPLVVLIALPNEMDQSRFAVSAGRSIGNAVQRNRAKRILRETIRPLIPTITPGWDLVILARKPMTNASFDEIGSALTSLLSRTNLLEKTP
jgi:ribonuclease P protein component